MLEASITEALIALSFPVNTGLLILLNHRQREGNHHTQTIRALVEKQISPAEISEAMDKSTEAHASGGGAGP